MDRPITLMFFLAMAFAAVTIVQPALGQGGSDAPLTAASPYDTAPLSRTITIDNFSFMPAPMTIPVGTTITWINRDDVPHTVVAENQQFKSKALDTDEKFSYTFDKPGTYSYFCSIHPKMVAKIIVEEAK
ncbi:MAG: cupredoxin family copper-binding protein [Terriglobales bacterium]|jgi:plastocyanin